MVFPTCNSAIYRDSVNSSRIFRWRRPSRLSETLSWIHGKHNLRFGGDYRRVHHDFLSSSNATGSFTFSGLFTEDANQDRATGSSLADLLLGLPQETTLDSAVSKSYLRDNVFDAYAQDDWRVLPQLTLLYGCPLRVLCALYGEVRAPGRCRYESSCGVYGHDGSAGGRDRSFSGKLPDSLVFPFRTAFAPRLGLALRLPKQTVVRAGFGMNYTVGQYATFATTMAHQPPFANEQTNQEATANGEPTSACARNVAPGCLTLAAGISRAEHDGQLRTRSALSTALRRGVES